MNVQLHNCPTCRRSYWTAKQFKAHDCAKPAGKKRDHKLKTEVFAVADGLSEAEIAVLAAHYQPTALVKGGS